MEIENVGDKGAFYINKEIEFQFNKKRKKVLLAQIPSLIGNNSNTNRIQFSLIENLFKELLTEEFSFVILPELSCPFDYYKEIDLMVKENLNEIVCVFPFEHIRYRDFFEILTDEEKEYYPKVSSSNRNKNVNFVRIYIKTDSQFLIFNQSKICPHPFEKSPLKDEDFYPGNFIYRFFTNQGNFIVLICKDFLANEEIIFGKSTISLIGEMSNSLSKANDNLDFVFVPILNKKEKQFFFLDKTQALFNISSTSKRTYLFFVNNSTIGSSLIALYPHSHSSFVKPFGSFLYETKKLEIVTFPKGINLLLCDLLPLNLYIKESTSPESSPIKFEDLGYKLKDVTFEIEHMAEEGDGSKKSLSIDEIDNISQYNSIFQKVIDEEVKKSVLLNKIKNKIKLINEFVSTKMGLNIDMYSYLKNQKNEFLEKVMEMDDEKIKEKIEHVYRLVNSLSIDDKYKTLAFQVLLKEFLLDSSAISDIETQNNQSKAISKRKETLSEFISKFNKPSQSEISILVAYWIEKDTDIDGSKITKDDILKGFLRKKPSNLNVVLNQCELKGWLAKDAKKDGLQTYVLTKTGLDYVKELLKTRV